VKERLKMKKVELTGNEREVKPGSTIISTTDLNGTIVECNDDFVDISGYTRQELIGQPHNILRHTDVPAAVFKDLWQTLKQGKPWTQYVKNRCKNGDFYWVKANITPVLRANELVGYQSVRTRISDAEKASAEALYKQIQNGKASIRQGYLMSPSRRFNLFHHIHPVNVMVSLIVFLIALQAVTSAGLLTIPAAVGLPVAAILLVGTFMGRRYVFSRLKKARQIMTQVRSGNFHSDLETYGFHSLSGVLASVKMMQTQVGAETAQRTRQLHENTRLKVALDSATTNMMVADQNNDVIYLNHALHDLLKRHASAIAEEVPGFDADKLVGKSIDVFHRHPQHQKQLLANLTDKHVAEISVGNLILKLTMQPVINDEQKRIGTIVEWMDLTQQRSIEETLNNALSLASKGHTDIKLNTQGLEGFFHTTATDINALLATMNGALEDMVGVMVNLASGNMTTRVEKDLQGSLAAMKGAMNVSLDNLSVIMLQIKEVAASASNASSDSAKAANDLSVRTQQAAATLEELNATMQNINQLQIENTQSLTEVSGLTRETMQENDKAGEVMLASVEAMESIRETSAKIGDIIGMIDSIAFQTNLLALNAAVEAARAGEHGRGFAVVANEVRTLAAKSADAAQEIKKLIEDSGQRINEGADRVQQSHEVFKQVNESVAKIGSTLETVTASISDQQQSVSEVTRALGSLDENIQNNAALVEETSASAESLHDQASLLTNEVQKFQISESLMQGKAQSYPAVHGVRLSEARQKMRIWRTMVQSYLCGMEVDIDLQAAVDPTRCSVGQALGQLLSADPSLEALDQMKEVMELHVRQHNLVKLVLECRDAKCLPEDFNTLSLQDGMLDEFVIVTEKLDKALGVLEQVVFEHSRTEPLPALRAG
jgi:methyl-accepting chemotaxis protein